MIYCNICIYIVLLNGMCLLILYQQTQYNTNIFQKLYIKDKHMRELALSDEILMKIEKPARYIGGEVNMVKKNPKNVDVRFAMCFPDVCSQ